MAIYFFDTMDQADATAFTSTDILAFQGGTAAGLTLTDTPEVSSFLGTTFETITLSDSTHSLTFIGSQLSDASFDNQLVFDNGDALYIGLSGSTGAPSNDIFTLSNDTAGHGAVAYGLAGDDNITAGNANDTIYGGDGDDHIHGLSSTTDAGHHFTESDYYLGGAGSDSIDGGAGNDHIYGNVATNAAGLDDGNDTINGEGGNDYINGNAGDDSIAGGSGNDKAYGGAGDDHLQGFDGNDYLQGNKGDDTVFGNDGNDTLHGGAGNDVVFGDSSTPDSGNDQMFGDNGDDTIGSQAGFDTLTGGAGNDLFFFYHNTSAPIQGVLDHGTTAADADQVATITDFTSGQDSIYLGFAVAAVIHGSTGATFTDAQAAETYATTLLSGHDHDVVAIDVGSDTYLFYDHTDSTTTGSVVNSAIALSGVTASTITADDFVS